MRGDPGKSDSAKYFGHIYGYLNRGKSGADIEERINLAI